MQTKSRNITINMDPNIFKGRIQCAFANKDNCYRIYQDVKN